MSGFKNRDRYTETEARDILENTTSNVIMHLLDNEDGTFSIMGHIVCEHCDYCCSQGDARWERDIVAVPAKRDPYENQER